jgi:hypothetical protein
MTFYEKNAMELLIPMAFECFCLSHGKKLPCPSSLYEGA